MNPAGEMSGEARLAELLHTHHRGAAKDIQAGILRALNDFIEDTAQSDDITLLTAKRV